MIINTDKLRFRMLSGGHSPLPYIAVYGTQDDPHSPNYDFLTDIEAVQMAGALDSIADKLKDEAERLRRMIPI